MKKVIYVDRPKKKYVLVRLFKTRHEMRAFYKKDSPEDPYHSKVRGVSVHRTYFKPGKNKKWTLLNKTGEILLSLQDCGAGVVAHEFMHAVLWAHKHTENKRQFPIVIKNMEEEEYILRNLTLSVGSFYDWYWKIVDKLKK